MFRLNSGTLAFLIVALVLFSLTPDGAAGDNLCAKARYSDVNSVLRGSGDPSFERDCFETYLPSAGLLMLEVTVPGAAQPEPRLEFLGRACDLSEGDHEPLSYQDKIANSLLLEVPEAGNYLYCVAAQDPAEVLGDYRLSNGFAAVFNKDDPDEHEPDPEPIVSPTGDCSPARLSAKLGAGPFGAGGFDKDDPDEHEPDPEPIASPGDGSPTKLSGKLGVGRFGASGFDKDDPDEHEPDPEPIVFDPDDPDLSLLQRICRHDLTDDHADTFRCATSLCLGQEVGAEIRNHWRDDADLFTFVVEELATVRIETTGNSDTFGGLYDRYGYRLKTADEGGSGANFRIVKTLSPGRYFVRVAGNDGAEGSYGLTVVDLSSGE